MTQDPYRSARRVFWVVDKGSSHRGGKAIDRLPKQYPNLILVHTPVHASWLNQQEFTSGSSRARCSHPLRPTTSSNWNAASSPSKYAHELRLAPSPGASPVLRSSAASKSWQRDP